jgi:hypothetical protein
MLTTALVCAECGREDDDRERAWQGHLVDLDDDGADEVVFFCPDCAAREFGVEGGAR